MQRISRRSFLAASALTPAALSAADGVSIGIQGYSFRDRSLDEAILATRQLGVTSYELYQKHMEPPSLSREALRDWRLNTPLKPFETAARKFADAGIQLWSYGYNFRDDFTDPEIARGFEMARALGVQRINASANVTTAARIDRYASKARIYVGLHNHANLVENEFARAEDYQQALAGRSEFLAITFDIGHWTAAGFDAVPFLEQHHDHIITLHLKDRKKGGANVRWGDGDTPIRQVLQVLRDKKYGIPAMIEYEYKGQNTVNEIRSCLEYCRRALE